MTVESRGVATEAAPGSVAGEGSSGAIEGPGTPPEVAGRTMGRSISRKEMARVMRRQRLLGLEDPEERDLIKEVQLQRPKTPGQCAERGLGTTAPCIYVSCRHHLYLDVNPETGTIKLNFPDKEPWELEETCVLAVASRDGITLEETGSLMNLTRERVRQVETRGLEKLRMMIETGKGNPRYARWLEGIKRAQALQETTQAKLQELKVAALEAPAAPFDKPIRLEELEEVEQELDDLARQLPSTPGAGSMRNQALAAVAKAVEARHQAHLALIERSRLVQEKRKATIEAKQADAQFSRQESNAHARKLRVLAYVNGPERTPVTSATLARALGEAATHNIRYWFERQLAGGYVTKHTGGWLISEKGRLFINQVAAEEKRLEVAAAVAQAKAATP